MLEFFDSLFLVALLAVVLLGGITGFSPTFYITQIGISAHSKRTPSFMTAVMIGVLLGIILLCILFQFVQPDTLHNVVGSAANATLISVVLNIIIGIILIVAGLWYVNKKPNRIDTNKNSIEKLDTATLVSLGFSRTVLSISGVTATFLASAIIMSVKTGIVSHLLLTGVFLIAAVAPFIIILATMNQRSEQVERVLNWLRTQLVRFNYKLVIGVAGILIGSAVIIFNILKLISF